MVDALLDRLREIREAGGALGASGATPDEVVRRAESDGSLAQPARDLGLSPVEMVSALAFATLGDGNGPTLVRQGPRRPRLERALSEKSLGGLFPGVARPTILALSAGLLQVHDFWDASHAAAQEADDLGESSVSAYWHGIAHRREPDPGNASYWFRRVGRHAIFGPLAAEARPIVATDEALATRLLPRDAWDPSAFIDVCTRAKGGQVTPLRRLQRQEMVLLLGASIPGAERRDPEDDGR